MRLFRQRVRENKGEWRDMTPEESKAFDEAFDAMSDAFQGFNRVFDKFDAAFRKTTREGEG